MSYSKNGFLATGGSGGSGMTAPPTVTETRDYGGTSAVVTNGATSPALTTRSITLTKTQLVQVFAEVEVVTPAANAAGHLLLLQDGATVGSGRWHNENTTVTTRFMVSSFKSVVLGPGTYVFTVAGDNDPGSTTSVTYEYAALVVTIVDYGSPTIQAWQAPTLLNSWTNSGGTTYPPAGYYLGPDGVVHLRGLITGGVTASVAFILPAGYRPEYRAAVVAAGGATDNYIEVQQDGSVYISVKSTTNVALDGITFRQFA
jgi:hypothetical protein